MSATIAVEDKIWSTKEGIPSPAQNVEHCSLSGDNPFFDIILSKSHVTTPYRLRVPKHIIPILPRVKVPMVLTHADKSWNMSYNGKDARPRFEYSHWRNFVADNNLKCDDACIFEVLESTDEILRLKVLILRNTDALPSELQAEIESRGKTAETAIELD